MKDEWLIFFAGAAAMFAGGLRIATTFVAWDGANPMVELLALEIDLLALFGLIGIWLAQRSALGWPGLAAFVLAASGLASIVGPDGVAFGIDTYLAGVHVIAVGLALMGGLMLIHGQSLNRLAGLCWIGSLVCGIAGFAAGFPVEGFAAGGVLYGAGFMLAGLGLV